jgi:hypothetical protein
MTLEFINKRIAEQEDYLLDLWFSHIHGEIDLDRYELLYKSASSQLEYFEIEKQKLLGNEKS